MLLPQFRVSSWDCTCINLLFWPPIHHLLLTAETPLLPPNHRPNRRTPSSRAPEVASYSAGIVVAGAYKRKRPETPSSTSSSSSSSSPSDSSSDSEDSGSESSSESSSSSSSSSSSAPSVYHTTTHAVRRSTIVQQNVTTPKKYACIIPFSILICMC